MTRLILDLCGGSGSWSRPYKEANDYFVVVIDPIAGTGDVRLSEFIETPVHGILAAPPCTDLSGSGARWWEGKGEAALLDALSVVDACLRAVTLYHPKWWVLENPVGRLGRFLGPARMTFDPSDFGDPYTKRTLLWGDFTPPIRRPVHATEGSKLWKLGPSEDRAAIRSITPPGFARAFFKANP